MDYVCEGRASILLLGGPWFNSLGLHEVLEQDIEPQTAPGVLVGTLHGLCMHELISHSGKKRLLNW